MPPCFTLNDGMDRLYRHPELSGKLTQENAAGGVADANSHHLLISQFRLPNAATASGTFWVESGATSRTLWFGKSSVTFTTRSTFRMGV